MSKLYEYTATYVTWIKPDGSHGTEGVVMDATDANHALSEMVDIHGPETVIVSIVRGAERPYGTSL